MEYLRDYILSLMHKSAYRPMTMKDLVEHFTIPRPKRDRFAAIIEQLTDAGEIILIKGKRYGLPKKLNLVVGKLSVHPDGFGFVAPEEGGDDVFIKGRELNTAMHGDKVVARLEHLRRGERREGRVIRIMERAQQTVVGRFERYSTYGYLTPYDPRLVTDIWIPLKASMDAQTGAMAVAEIVNYASRNRTPEGRIVEVLGPAEDRGVDELVVIRKYGLPHEFAAAAQKEARAVPALVEEKDLRRRVDMRNTFTVTIDGETAKDFDDAVSLELSDKQTYHLWVHIADVSHYVRPGSALDEEARARGTSVYFPGTVIPMLPEELSNGICSLNPRVDRLAFTVFMEVDRQGQVVRYDFLETVIKSDARMTYTQVRDILEGTGKVPAPLPPGAAERFRLMAELAEKLRKARMKKGSIDFDLPVAEIVLDLQGRIQEVVRSERNVAHRLIEEFMLAANRTVASYATRLELPFVYRVHEKPSDEKIEFFRRFVANFGHYLPEGKIPPLALAQLLSGLEGKREAPVINNLLLRSLKQARYSEVNSGHFGLAFDDYTHFTSPIRRYPDLLVHRMLKTIIRQGRYGEALASELEATLPALTIHCSERERVAVDAEREIVQIKKTRFMLEKVGEEYDGFITGVTTFGVFVELADFMIEGLAHVSSLEDDYYVFDEETQTLRGEHTRRSFRVGDAVRVRVAKVNLERRQIDFALLPGSGTIAPAGASPKAAAKRRKTPGAVRGRTRRGK
jgi:ribonuclease R